MAYQEDPLDVFLTPEQYKPFEYPTFGVNSQIYLDHGQQLSELCSIKSQSTKWQLHQTRSAHDMESPDAVKISQSTLHNCPKHLIKYVIQSLGFPTSSIIESTQFLRVDDSVKECMKSLLSILQMCSKGKIRSMSKQILKLVFEEGSQHLNTKSKLMQNPLVKKVFMSSNTETMSKGKTLLREFTIRRLQFRKVSELNDNKVIRKIVNQRYLQVFVRELREGKVSERVCKEDKEWILSNVNI